MLGLPRGTTLEKLVFGDVLSVADAILANSQSLMELLSRAQGEVSIREALRELELWGVGASFSLTGYRDSAGRELKLIKDWKDLVNQVRWEGTGVRWEGTGVRWEGTGVRWEGTGVRWEGTGVRWEWTGVRWEGHRVSKI